MMPFAWIRRESVCVCIVDTRDKSQLGRERERGGERERERDRDFVCWRVCVWVRESPRRDKNEVASCADRQTEAKNGFDQSFFFFHLPTT